MSSSWLTPNTWSDSSRKEERRGCINDGRNQTHQETSTIFAAPKIPEASRPSNINKPECCKSEKSATCAKAATGLITVTKAIASMPLANFPYIRCDKMRQLLTAGQKSRTSPHDIFSTPYSTKSSSHDTPFPENRSFVRSVFTKPNRHFVDLHRQVQSGLEKQGRHYRAVS